MSDVETRTEMPHGDRSARRALIVELANERGPIRAAEVFRMIVESGLDVSGNAGRNRTYGMIRSILKSGDLEAGSIIFADQTPGTTSYGELDQHIIRIARDNAPISLADITRKLLAEGFLADLNQPEKLVWRRARELRKYDKIKAEWIRDGKRSEERDRLLIELPVLLEQWQPIGVRGVFYQLVSLGFGPKEPSFLQRVNRVVTELRVNDVIPWEWISETGRTIDQRHSYDQLADAVRIVGAADWYTLNPWIGLNERVQIWIEKRGLAGVVNDVTYRYHVPLLASGGFSSLTLVNKAAELINDFDGFTYCYYFGDLDPSGTKIDPAIVNRLESRADSSKFHFSRIALKPEHIDKYDLPTRLARKGEDDKNPNLAAYEAEYGDEAVELDALPPDTLRDMVRAVIQQHIDEGHIAKVERKEGSDRKKLKRALSKLNLG